MQKSKLLQSSLLAVILAANISACQEIGEAEGEQEGTNTETENTAPVAAAGSDQTVSVGTNISLSASSSSDADGDTLTYQWSITSQPSGSNASLTGSDQSASQFTAEVSGTYEISLTVSDGEETSTDTVIITVQDQQTSQNTSPEANAGANVSISLGETVTIDGSASSDADSDTLTYSWSIVSSPDGSTASLTDSASISTDITPDLAGIYSIRLTVNDGNDTDSDNVRITVSDDNSSNSGGSETTANIDTWIINNSSTSIYITSSTGAPVLEDVQKAELVTENQVEYMYVEATGIPKYDVVVTQDIVDELNERPKANSDFKTGSTTAAVGQELKFGANIGYDSSDLNCNDTGGDGYWPPGPACPQDQAKENYFPTEPTVEDGECETGLGAVGLMVNGTSIYNWGDGMTYGDNVWYNLAPIAEQYDVDICGGHATTTGDYHHHFYTSCLADLLGDKGDDHSPIYGFAADGYPVYGPYESDGELAVSGWKTRDYGSATSEGGCNTAGERTCILVDQYDISKGVETVDAGPDIGATVTSASRNTFTASDGFYLEDYYYAGETATGAQLDQHNGHDNDDGRGYHYHITLESVDGELTPSFPFTVGPNFKGELPSNTFARCNSSTGMGPPPGN